MITLLLMLPIVLFVFIIIGISIYKSSMKRKDVSIWGVIFSWLFLAFYALTFFATIIFSFLGNEKWMMICLSVLAITLLSLILISVISGAIKKYQIKHFSKLVQGKLVGAVEKSSTSIEATGREPISRNYYSLVFEYEEGGQKKICLTNELYQLPEVACINKYYKKTMI